MSISNLTVNNGLKLNCASLSATDSVSTGTSSVGDHIEWTENTNFNWKIEKNVSALGFYVRNVGTSQPYPSVPPIFMSSDGHIHAQNLTINSVAPSHLPVAGGSVDWSGSGISLAVSAPGVLTTDLVIVTTKTPSDQSSAVFSHAIPTANTVTLHLEGADATNTSSHHYVVYRGLA